MFGFIGKAALCALFPLLTIGNPIVTGLYPRHVAPRNPFEINDSENLERYMNREWRRRFRKQGLIQ